MQLTTGCSTSGWLIGCTLSLCLSASGCNKPNVPAEPTLARTSLEAALAAWKSGESPEALAKRTPPITMTDFAWRAGQKLTDFRLPGEPANDGVNLHFQAELMLANQQGSSTTEKVGYIVGTDPLITIFREVH